MTISTIYALSSGGLPSGVAIIRLSGPQSLVIAESMGHLCEDAGCLMLVTLKDPVLGGVLDRCLVTHFVGPRSFTGEDCFEIHCHGGRAVVSAFLECLAKQSGCRLAEAGEFSRRAFDNGKIDLTEAEALSDLISADTEMQRRLALSGIGGKFKQTLEDWRSRLLKARSFVEAHFDFSDEDDVPFGVDGAIWQDLTVLRSEMGQFLDDDRRGEIIRDGFRVAIVGKPNAGKSSLINALVKRDVAIVSDIAGTTRDVIEVRIDLDGVPVVLFDTAGIRPTGDVLEQMGIDRTFQAISSADLVLELSEDGCFDLLGVHTDVVGVQSKADDAVSSDYLSISVKHLAGLDALIEFLRARVAKYRSSDHEALIFRARHRELLAECNDCLAGALSCVAGDIVLAAEYLRVAGDKLGRLSGRIDAEDLLDVIFSEFCIGK